MTTKANMAGQASSTRPMVTVKVLKTFYDLKCHKDRPAGTTFRATEGRAAQIESVLPGYISVLHEEVREEPVKEHGTNKPEEQPVPPTEERPDLSKLTVPQLKALAKERGIAVPRGAKKADLVALLEE